MNLCIRCEKPTSNPKFCGRSCAATYNNQSFPKRTRTLGGKCLTCETPISVTRKFCNMECRRNRADKIRKEQGTLKRCNACFEVKDITEFSINRSCSDGLMRQCRKCNTARVQIFNQNRTAVAVRKTQYRKHGLTKEQYDELHQAQDGKCAVCEIDLSMLAPKRIHIDHDHGCCVSSYSCGECIRGILCHDCNVGLGLFKDDLGILEKAMKYLDG